MRDSPNARQKRLSMKRHVCTYRSGLNALLGVPNNKNVSPFSRFSARKIHLPEKLPGTRFQAYFAESIPTTQFPSN